MTANNPLSTAPAVSTVVPSGLLPTGTTGVRVVPIPIIWDPNAVAANGNTGDWKAIVGTDGVGMGIVIASDSVGLAKDATFTGGTAKVQVTNFPVNQEVTLETDAIGLAKDSTLTGGNAKVQVTTMPSVAQKGTPLVASNTATCASTDNKITTAGFNHVSLKNKDATNSMVVAIDADSTTSQIIIPLDPGESFDDYISGTALHFSASTGSPVLKYALR